MYGNEFELLKFRGMRIDHDGVNCWAATDEHQTTVGRWMRRTSLDELPQLWNVLRGDMSLIGPRPERPQFAIRFGAEIPGYSDRHRLPVGLTGWAQVNGLRGGETSLTERARFDNLYIEGWSLWLDVVILLRTAGAVIRMATASASRSGHSLRRPPSASGSWSWPEEASRGTHATVLETNDRPAAHRRAGSPVQPEAAQWN